MKGCYALIYRREDADSEITIGNLRLPLPDVVDEVKAQLQEDFIKETMEGNKSMKVWNEQIDKRYKYLKNLWEHLEVSLAIFT